MLPTSPSLVLIVAAFLAFLAVLQLWLAARHDHAVSIHGPLEQEQVILTRIQERRAALLDIEHDLQKRREALAVQADVQIEVDALTRRRDELLVEWNQREEQRAEVLAIRRELEEAQIEKLRFDAELAEARAEHEEIRDRLARAERLLGTVDALRTEHDGLLQRIEQLTPELRRLEEAQERVERLADRARSLDTDVARLDGLQAAGLARLDELGAQIAAARESATELSEERTRALAEQAAAELSIRSLEAQARDCDERLRHGKATLERLEVALEEADHAADDARDRLEELQEQQARLSEERTSAVSDLHSLRREVDRLDEKRASLEARNAKLARQGSEGGGSEDDPLRELKSAPQVITVLRGWDEVGAMEENDALLRVKQHFRATGLTYPDRTLRAFHTAMKVNETTQMAVLAGISGTGKSQLPRQYAAGMGIGFLQVPVQPRWDSPQDLMGFYNYVEGRFRPTDMARALWAMDELNNPEGALPDRMLMILLDEMNLARVEYYFSDFLSRLESRPSHKETGEPERRKDAEIELEIPMLDGQVPRIFPGYNLLFAGTMNEDESTQSLSDKVVDRANVIRFAAPEKIVGGITTTARPEPRALRRSTWDRWTRGKRTEAERTGAQESIEEMVTVMRDLGRPFGHRLGRAMLAYVDRYPVTDGVPEIVSQALADQVEMRLLPKLRGVEVEAKEQEFGALRSLVSVLGDDALAEAIGKSLEAAAATGQFVWQGVSRA